MPAHCLYVTERLCIDYGIIVFEAGVGVENRHVSQQEAWEVLQIMMAAPRKLLPSKCVSAPSSARP